MSVLWQCMIREEQPTHGQTWVDYKAEQQEVLNWWWHMMQHGGPRGANLGDGYFAVLIGGRPYQQSPRRVYYRPMRRVFVQVLPARM